MKRFARFIITFCLLNSLLANAAFAATSIFHAPIVSTYQVDPKVSVQAFNKLQAAIQQGYVFQLIVNNSAKKNYYVRAFYGRRLVADIAVTLQSGQTLSTLAVVQNIVSTAANAAAKVNPTMIIPSADGKTAVFSLGKSLIGTYQFARRAVEEGLNVVSPDGKILAVYSGTKQTFTYNLANDVITPKVTWLARTDLKAGFNKFVSSFALLETAYRTGNVSATSNIYNNPGMNSDVTWFLSGMKTAADVTLLSQYGIWVYTFFGVGTINGPTFNYAMPLSSADYNALLNKVGESAMTLIRIEEDHESLTNAYPYLITVGPDYCGVLAAVTSDSMFDFLQLMESSAVVKF